MLNLLQSRSVTVWAETLGEKKHESLDAVLPVRHHTNPKNITFQYAGAVMLSAMDFPFR